MKIIIDVLCPRLASLDLGIRLYIQFLMRNPIFRSKISNFCVQRGKIRKNEILKISNFYVLNCYFSFFVFFYTFIGLSPVLFVNDGIFLNGRVSTGILSAWSLPVKDTAELPP